MTTTNNNNAKPSDLALYAATASFAAQKHQFQVRKNAQKTPYILHPLDVAARLSSPLSSLYPNPPIEILQAAVLHDTVEDTDTTREELVEMWGEKVAEIVMECTDDKKLEKQERKDAQVKNAPHKSWEAKNVKLGDKLSNLSDLAREGGIPVGWTKDRIQEYFVWAKKVTDGCKGANPGLEAQLEKIYKEAHFEFEGQKYKCHPSYTG